MINAYAIGIRISLTNHVSPSLGRMMADLAKTESEAHKLQRRMDKIRDGFALSFASIGAGLALAAPFKAGLHEALNFERAVLRIKNIGGMDAASVTEIRGSALAGQFKGIAATETVDLFRDLHAAFGHTQEAKEFLPHFAEFARITQATFGKSAIAGEEDVKALAKFAERRGGTKSPQAMSEQLDLAMRILNASGGAISPKELLAFQARMGAMGIGMSNDGVAKMWALMQEQGGSKAGTALNSAMQNLINGRGTEGSGHVLRKIGWVDEAANHKNLREIYGDNWNKHLNKVTANALKNSDLAKEDMVGWVRDVGLPLINQYVDKQGVKDSKKREGMIVSLLAQALSNRLGADSVALIATQMDRILKDHGIYQSSKGIRESGQQLDNSPLAKFQDLHARWETGLVNLGESALPIVVPLVEDLAISLRSFNEYAEKSPETIQHITSAFLGLAGVLIGGGVIGILANTTRSFVLLGETIALVAGVQQIGALQKTLGLGVAGAAAFAVVELGRLALALKELWDAKHHEGVKLTNEASQRLKDPSIQAKLKEMDSDFRARVPLPASGMVGTGPVPPVRSGVYVSGPTTNQKTVQVNSVVNIDGRKVADVVSMHQTTEMNKPNRSSPLFDSSLGVSWGASK